MSLSAGWLAYVTYHQRLSSDISYRFALVDTSALLPLIQGHPSSPMDDSTYGWIILDDAELAKALKLNGLPAPSFGQRSRTVSLWPQAAEAWAYGVPEHIVLGGDHPHTAWESGTLGGSLGSRRAGLRPQLRIECKVTYTRTNRYASSETTGFTQACDGELIYEGERPHGHLLFFSSIDDETYHTVIFSVQ